MSGTVVEDTPSSSFIARRKLLARAGLGIAGAAALGVVGYAPPAEAATSANDYFSVLFYGATGNGTTDDTAAIQWARTAAAKRGGGKVYLPDGEDLLKGRGEKLLQGQEQVRRRGEGRWTGVRVDNTVQSTNESMRG